MNVTAQCPRSSRRQPIGRGWIGRMTSDRLRRTTSVSLLSARRIGLTLVPRQNDWWPGLDSNHEVVGLLHAPSNHRTQAVSDCANAARESNYPCILR